MKQVAAVLFCFVWMAPHGTNAGDAMHQSRQCLVVTTPSWEATNGTLYILERNDFAASWPKPRGELAVVVGKAGMGWSVGASETGGTSGPRKRESDKKAPAGIFSLSKVFGYAATATTRMPYMRLRPETVCVDDPASERYTEIVTEVPPSERTWKHAENMRRADDLYKWGILVDQNELREPGAGSCIFLHIWRGPDQATVGCTAMSEKNILDIIRWLDPSKEPLLVQMPRPVYDRVRKSWNLPEL